MNRMSRTLAIGVVAASAVALLSGCGLFTPPERFTDKATLNDRVTTVEIDEPQGDVSVHGDGDATEIEISRTVSYRGERTVGITYEVSDGVLVLSGCGRNCIVSYIIELPAGVDVTGSTTNGALELEGVNEVDVSTSNGRVELDDVAGSIEVETSNGRIEGSDLRGTGIRASSSNGAIDLSLDAPQDVEARTSNGSIELAVPDDPDGYQVIANTSNGPVDIEIDEDSDGRYVLDLGTSNGSITVTNDD